MTRIRIIGLCLAALFAIGAVAASASSAALMAPERGKCKAKPKTGKYLDAACTEPGTGGGKGHEYEWTPLAKPGALTSTTGEAKLKSFTPEGAELPAVVCASSKSKGKVGATTSEKVVVTFSGCESAGEKCTGSGTKTKPKTGQIITYELAGTLGIIEEATKKIGEVLAPEKGSLSSKFTCGANSIETAGSVIGEFTSVNAKAATTNKFVFTATGAKQDPEKFEGGPKDTLKTEINGLGAGTFPFASVEITEATVKGPSSELRA